jgi:hypothetical protein
MYQVSVSADERRLRRGCDGVTHFSSVVVAAVISARSKTESWVPKQLDLENFLGPEGFLVEILVKYLCFEINYVSVNVQKKNIVR